MINVRSEIRSRETGAQTGVWAGVDIHGEGLRYAAMEYYRGRQRRLLRLGHCDFDFDVAHSIYQGENSEHLQVMSEALQDAFAGASVEQLHVIVHPPDCYSFFTPVPTAFSTKECEQRLQEEASLLVQTEAGSALRLSGDALYDETLNDESVRWYHVLGVEKDVWVRLQRLMGSVPVEQYRPMLSMQGAGRVVTAEWRHQDVSARTANAPYRLAIGWYPHHVEFSLSRGEEWRFGHFTAVGSPSDCAYFAVALLNRMKLMPQDVGQLYLYGNQVDVAQFDLLQRIFGVRPVRLSALSLLDANTEGFTARFNPEAYATCIGAAL